MIDPVLVLGKFVFAILLGGLIGIEREFIRKWKKNIPMGVRTLMFISAFGTITVLISDFLGSTLLVIVGLSGIIIFSALSFYARYRDYRERGLTTYTAALITFLVGVLVGYDQYFIAVFIAVITAGILSLSDELKSIIKLMSEKELNSTIIFAIIAVVLLPLLPDTVIDPLGLFNPFRFWLLVVMISGISFASYLLLKVVKDGLSITGFLGGFLNAKVVINQFAEKVSKNVKLLGDAFNGSLLSVASSIITMLLIVVFGVFCFDIISGLIIPLVMVTGLMLLLFVRGQRSASVKQIALSNPFTLIKALRIAFLIFIFTEGTGLLINLLHSSLVYPSIVLSSLVSTFATTASIVSLYNAGLITKDLTINLVILTAGLGVISKLFFARIGGKRLFKKLLFPLTLWFFLIFTYFVLRQLLPI